ncbi:lipid-A-disaccharide synthase-related protein [Gloeocapsa sp. PCC 73106]|uniref:lipid-A-disaccharide synthase-related protein n=1 Tax=Gloeocapsa sp. PCC 73106 TaxID=102232 RepID=UPI0002AC7302|nr:lipid-A-disaccharide synthase-related protein [Gloeocapsa sp. PCC 73106]ELR99413.1 hypothetical protein GLO73106DRAFT_00032640 [Gloeocapsa sp. PCC 73106]
MRKKLLCLSNGHGEDAIAVAVLQHLKNQGVEVKALPLVGQGTSYQLHRIPLIGPLESLPSGGFIYMDTGQLWQDLQSGLLQLTLKQYQAMKQWVQSQPSSQLAILAVGDILPLAFAWLSGVNYAFIGTAKSDYYLRNEQGWLRETSLIERCFGSVYLPWERWLMTSSRCLGVFPRDQITAKNLQKYSISVFDYGNPMMDVVDTIPTHREISEKLTILLLPGSRPLEAMRNWRQILQGVAGIINKISNESLLFLGAIAPNLDLHQLELSLIQQGWQSAPEVPPPLINAKLLLFQQKQAILALTQADYADCLLKADLAIAMAGTATEQFVGLGKPAIVIPGQGPQYTRAFAQAQQRLLGPSLILVETPEQIVTAIESLLQNPTQLQQIAINGQQRMGKPGASQRIAQALLKHLFLG